MEQLLNAWKIEFDDLKNSLNDMGDKSNTAEYNLLSCEALRLMMCINDVNSHLLGLIEVKDGE